MHMADIFVRSNDIPKAITHFHCALTALEREYGSGIQNFVTSRKDPFISPGHLTHHLLLIVFVCVADSRATSASTMETNARRDAARKEYDRIHQEAQVLLVLLRVACLHTV